MSPILRHALAISPSPGNVPPPAEVKLPREFAIFLDFLRLSAAIDVFLAHAPIEQWSGMAWTHIFSIYGHSSVVVFFILSGYLISMTARRDGTLLTYAINRATRIYSVMIPALFVSWAVAYWLRSRNIDPTLTGYQLLEPWKYLPLFLTFSTEFWGLYENMFANPAFWSLSYEVWYYVVFGIWYFAKRPTKWIWIAAALAVMGPKLWLLAPLWVLGAAIRWLHTRHTMTVTAARLLLVGALAAVVIVKASGIDNAFTDAMGMTDPALSRLLHYTRSWPGDYLFAVFAGLALFAVRYAELKILHPFGGAIAGLTSISFSLYMLHFPLLLFFGVVFKGSLLWTMGATLGVVVILGTVFERHRQVLRTFLWRVAGLLTPPKLVSAVPPIAAPVLPAPILPVV